MTELPPMLITAAGLLATDWCPARCRHCYVASGPQRRAWMTVEAAEAHLAALARLGVSAEGIHVGGGEPFGDFDRLLAIVLAARRAGLAGVGYVETCGYWATDETLVRRRLVALAEAGMMQVSISADPYHQEFVPPERPQLLYRTARAVLGPRGVRVRRWKWLQSPRDLAAMPETERGELFRSFLRRYPERMSGRAAEHLAPLVEHVSLEGLPQEDCRRSLLESRHVHIEPEGWVYPGTCAGISLGRATPEQPLDELLRSRPATGLPLIARLIEGGPRHLLDMAAAHGFQPDPHGYAGNCHLCWSIRKHLARIGPWSETLQPQELYLTTPDSKA